MGQKTPYFQMGIHLGWKEEVEPKFNEILESVGDEIKRELTSNPKEVYLNLLQELESRREGTRIGGMLLVGKEYFGVTLGKDEICIFDSHGSHAITRGNALAFMVKTTTLEHAAELLAFRRGSFGVKRLDEVSCYAVKGKVEGASETLTLINPVEVETITSEPIQRGFEPVITSENRSDVLEMIRALEKIVPSDSQAVQAILSKY